MEQFRCLSGPTLDASSSKMSSPNPESKYYKTADRKMVLEGSSKTVGLPTDAPGTNENTYPLNFCRVFFSLNLASNAPGIAAKCFGDVVSDGNFTSVPPRYPMTTAYDANNLQPLPLRLLCSLRLNMQTVISKEKQTFLAGTKTNHYYVHLYLFMIHCPLTSEV